MSRIKVTIFKRGKMYYLRYFYAGKDSKESTKTDDQEKAKNIRDQFVTTTLATPNQCSLSPKLKVDGLPLIGTTNAGCVRVLYETKKSLQLKTDCARNNVQDT